MSMAGLAPESPKPAARAGLMTSRQSASIDASEAARRLAQAELMRSAGADPLPGELNERYFQRQEKLRVLVERARQRVNETRLPLLAQH